MMSARLRFRSSKTMKDLASNTLAKDKFCSSVHQENNQTKGFLLCEGRGDLCHEWLR